MGALPALATLLGGCVAVAALPMLAGGAMFAGGNVKIRAATPRPKASPALTQARPERTSGNPVAVPGAGVVLTALTALPKPEVEAGGPDPWEQFAAWSLARARELESAGARKSVLYDTRSPLYLPRTRECRGEAPAVIVDLDPEAGLFSPADIRPAPPTLTTELARLREAGVVVLWLSALPAARVGEVAEALRVSGLDPEGRDPLLLARGPDDRKQVLREEANKDVCVIAIAGDRKGDFDELFDYLRDPAAAVSLDSYLGAGWFLTPPPLG
jgi:hypothetical protein